MKQLNIAVLTVLLVFQTILSPISVFAEVSDDSVDTSVVAPVVGDDQTIAELDSTSDVTEPTSEASEQTESTEATDSIDDNTVAQEETLDHTEQAVDESDSNLETEKSSEQEQILEPALTTQFQLDFQKLVHDPNETGKGIEIVNPEDAKKVTPKSGDRVNIYYNFEIKDEGMAKREYFEFKLPETLLIYDAAALSGQIHDQQSGEHLFNYTLNKATRTVKITVADSVENAIVPGVKGGMYFMAQYGNFKGDSLEQTLEVEQNDLTFNFTFEPQNPAKQNITKTGKVGIAADGSRYIDWEVIYNYNGEDLSPNVTFTDTIGAGHKLDLATPIQYATATVTKTLENVTIGTFSKATAVEAATITVAPEVLAVSEKQNVSFDMTTGDKAVKITYRTLITKPATEGTHSFTNKAGIDGAPTNAHSWSAEGKASTEYDPELVKHKPTGDNYNLNWKVEFNKIGKSFKDNTVIVDQLVSGQHVYDLGEDFKNVKISSANYSNGAWGAYMPLAADKYEISFNQETKQLNVKLIEGGTYAVKIEYPTKYENAEQPLFDVDPQKVENTVSVNGPYAENTNFKKSNSYLGGNGIGVKQLNNIDYANKTITWSIKFNTENKKVGNFTITDTLADYITFDGETSVKNCPENVKCEISGQTLEISNKLGENNEVVNRTYNFEVQFVTKYSNFPTSDAYKIENTANFVMFDSNGKQYTFNKSTNDPVEYLHARNANKTGFYNYKTQQFEWTATLNYDRKQLVAGTTITDQLNHAVPGQTYVLNEDGEPAIQLIKGKVNANGSISEGETVNLKDFFTVEVNEKATFQLKIKENVSTNDVFILKYNTKDDDKIIGSKNTNYKNTITLNIPGQKTASDYEEVAVTHANEIISKVGTQQPSDTKINWTLNVNRSGSSLTDVVVSDKLSQGTNVEHLLLKDTLRIKAITFNKNGQTVSNDGQTIAEAIELGWITKADVTLQGFELTFGDLTPDANGPKAFIVEYSSFYNGPQNGHYGNIATLTTSEATEGIKNTSGETNKEYKLNASDAYANYERGNLEITKIGKNNVTGDEVVLEGVTFELWNATKKFKLRDAATTSADGKVTFNNLGYGKYMLKETSGKDGYKKVEWHEIVIGKKEDFEKVVFNEEILNAVQFEKTFNDASGQLSDVQFELYRKDAAGDIRITQVTTASYLNGERLLTTTPVNPNLTFTPDANGKITVSYLLPGEYYFKEVATTEGFKLADSVQFTIKPDSVQLLTLDTIVNVKNPEPVTPAEPEENPEPVVPTEPEENPEPVTPTEPEKNPEPVTPTEPEENPEPVTPTEPEENPEPVTPTEPEENPEPVVPTEPEQNPDTGVTPTPEEKPEPVTPTEPEENPEPVTPTEPEENPEPVVPTEPEENPEPVTPELSPGTEQPEVMPTPDKGQSPSGDLVPDRVKEIITTTETTISNYPQANVTKEDLQHLLQLVSEYEKMSPAAKQQLENMIDINKVYEIIKANQKPTLPQTNGEQSPAWMMVGLLLIALSSTLLFNRRKNLQ